MPSSSEAANLEDTLTRLGYGVTAILNQADEVVEHARSSRPDALLIDMSLRSSDGRTAAAVIGGRFGMPVIGVANDSAQAPLDDAVKAQVYGFLRLPVSPEQIQATIVTSWARYVDQVEQHVEIVTLKQRLEDRKIIEQAKWVIVERRNMPEPEAMRLLQRQARNDRRKLVDVARSLVETANLFGAEQD
ncbi:MAG: ANTAR domain-containing protein [Planctomycetota bacterium]